MTTINFAIREISFEDYLGFMKIIFIKFNLPFELGFTVAATEGFAEIYRK